MCISACVAVIRKNSKKGFDFSEVFFLKCNHNNTVDLNLKNLQFCLYCFFEFFSTSFFVNVCAAVSWWRFHFPLHTCPSSASLAPPSTWLISAPAPCFLFTSVCLTAQLNFFSFFSIFASDLFACLHCCASVLHVNWSRLCSGPRDMIFKQLLGQKKQFFFFLNRLWNQFQGRNSLIFTLTWAWMTLNTHECNECVCNATETVALWQV